MPRYAVIVDVYRGETVFVEADNEDEAEDKAVEELYDRLESNEDYTIIEIELLEGEID